MLGKRKNTLSYSPPSKRKRRAVIEEITFDPQARKEFLTGFHKRKLQRQKHAQETAALKEREERKRQRAQIRAERHAHLEKHMAAMNEIDKVNAAARNFNQLEESITERKDSQLRQSDGIDDETEFDDDEQTTTVTIEEVDVTRDGLAKRGESDVQHLLTNHMEVGPGEIHNRNSNRATTYAKPKRRKKQFRYESKAERQANMRRERASSKAKRRGIEK